MPSPYDALLDPPADAPKASPYDALLPQKSPYDALLEQPKTITDPIEHAATNYDNPVEKEAAFNAYKTQAKQPSDVMGGVGRFIKSAATTIFPTPDANGQWHWPLASGAINLAKGVYQTGQNVMDSTGKPGSLGRTLSPLTGPIVPAAVNWWNEDPTAERAGRQLSAGAGEGVMSAAQMAEGLRRNVSALGSTLTGGAIGSTQAQLSDEDLRKRFDNDVQYRYLTQQAQKGITVPEALSGQTYGLSPEQLAAQGKPVDPQAIENIGTATNPANLVELGALTNPLARGVMAPAVSGIGKVLTGAANVADKIHINPAVRTLGAAEALFHGNPLAAAGALAAPVVSKGVSAAARGAGDLLTGAGEEMAGGQIPLGQSAATKIVKEGIKGAASSVPTAAAFAATGGTPEESGRQFFNAVGLGTLLSAASAAPKSGASGAIEQTAAGQQLASEGATTNFGTGYDAWHQEGMQSVSPQDANEINKYRGFLGRLRTPDGKPIQVYAVKGDKFGAVQKQLGEVDASGNPTNPNGKGLISPDGSQIFVNVDSGNVGEPLGHETGHAADLVAKYADSLLHQSLQSSIAQHLYSTDPQGNVIPTKDFADFMDNYQKAVGQKQMSRQDFEAEYVAETARKILSGQNIENFTLPKSLGEKVKDGITDFMSGIGVKPTEGNLGFGGKEISDITRNVSDLLRQPNTEPAPTSADYRIDQLKTTLANPPGRGATIEQLDQFAAAKKEYADLLKKKDFNIPDAADFPASGRPPVAPSTPQAPKGTMGDIPRVAAYLRQQGIPATEALQWANQAQGGTVEEKVVDALKQRANQKFPNVQSPPTPQSEPIPAQSGATPAGNPTATQEAPKVEQQTAIAEKPTEQQVTALVDQAEQAAIQKERNPNTKAAKDRIHKAKIDAILNDIGDDKTGLHKETDAFGNEKIIGDYDPSDPRQKALADLGGLKSEDAKKIQQIQDAKGGIQYVRYRSALSNTEQAQALLGKAERGDVDTGMDTRQKEYSADPASERTAGTIQHKVMIPVGTQMNSPSGRITSQFVVLDNILHNFASISEGLKEIVRPNPYGETAKEQEPLMVRDAQAYAANHAHGYKGDGSGPMEAFPDSGLPPVDPNYTPQQIPADRFAVLNFAFHNEGAGRLSAVNERIQKYQAENKPVPKSVAAQQARAQELYALATQNNPWVDHQTGETNQLRSEMKAAGFDTDVRLKSPFETLSPQHILETSDKPIPLKEGDIPSVRPHGFDVDPAELGKSGLPRDKAVGAGFLPTESTPEGEPTTPKAAETPPEGQSESPLSGVTSGEDTGKPEQGATPVERLAREAEEAGVFLSMPTLRAMIRNDQPTMDKIRARIQEATGKPARFLPATPYDPSKDNTPIIDPDAPLWEQKFERLSDKEIEHGLTPEEEAEIGRLQKLIVQKYGSFMAYARKKDAGQ